MPSSACENPVQSGDLQIYLRDINARTLLSREDETELAARIANGDLEARDQMIQANLRLVVHIARGFCGRGLSVEDLIAEGNLGLMHAVERFNGQLGVRFSTYASYWIKQSIRGALTNHAKPIRLPSHMMKVLAKWQKVSRRLTEELGRPPLAGEVGAVLGLSPKKLVKVAVAGQIFSLSRCEDHSHGGTSFLASLTDERTDTPHEQSVKAEEWARIAERLTRIDARSSAVVRMYFGLDNDEPLTLRQIGERLNLTHERARQLLNEALAELAVTAVKPKQKVGVARRSRRCAERACLVG